ncbi:MAG: alpha-galactosidase [Clostridia bacterium]|nr:alpha-galactosidase [Clostridia bacterium]
MDIKKTVIGASAAVTGAAAGIAAKKVADKTFCPICSAKKLINSFRLTQTADNNYNNGVALTPPMGWSSWNLFRHKISEKLIKEIADAMKDSGLVDAGYCYVNIDDCWQASERDSEGKLQCDKITFPNGIKALAEYVNERGIKLGIYSSNGTHTCEDYPASLRNERIDAETFAEWGIEYFKYDFCHNVPISSLAPRVIAVSFAEEGAGEPFAFFTSAEMKLKGLARIVPDEAIDVGSYVDGLDAKNGSFTVDVEAEKAGEYILNIDIRKDARKEKFIMAVVNGREEYHLYCASRKNFTPEGKLQTTVYLDEGINTVEFINPIASRMDSAAVQYKLMGRELKRATKLYAEKNGTEEKPIIYSICEWGFNRPWKWGAEAGNLWRTTGDIQAKWFSVMGIYEFTVRLHKYSAPGAWNDPDMLEVGNGDLTYEENKAHFSLWCMMNAPLILGNDVRKFIVDGKIDTESKIYQILTNKTMISINQDPLGVQCQRIKKGTTDILVKPLKDSKAALCVFNKGTKSSCARIDLKKIANLGFVNLPQKDGYKVTDVWDEKFTEDTRIINTVTESHGVKVFIIE